MTRRTLTQFASLIVFIIGLVFSAGCDSPAGDVADASDGWTLADAGDVAPNYPEIGVATFNVRLFFDTECDSQSGCGGQRFEQVPTQEEFEERAGELAAAVEGLDADVVLLQEIENQAALDELQSALDGAYPVAVIGETGWGGSVDVAVLARGELVDTRGYRDDRPLELPGGGEEEFAREFLRVDLEIDGEEVIVFSAHFTSKVARDDQERERDDARRLAEAQTARQIVEEVAANKPEALVVLGGDLNDTPESDSLQALTENDGFVRVAAEKSLDETYTYVWNWEAEAIDHLLLVPTSGGAYVAGSVQSLHDRNPAGYGGSDHGALVAEFEMR
jgi:endonuclease/exonuclease/phosphatase family metal-dependent hydrolase